MKIFSTLSHRIGLLIGALFGIISHAPPTVAKSHSPEALTSDVLSDNGLIASGNYETLAGQIKPMSANMSITKWNAQVDLRKKMRAERRRSRAVQAGVGAI